MIVIALATLCLQIISQKFRERTLSTKEDKEMPAFFALFILCLVVNEIAMLLHLVGLVAPLFYLPAIVEGGKFLNSLIVSGSLVGVILGVGGYIAAVITLVGLITFANKSLHKYLTRQKEKNSATERSEVEGLSVAQKPLEQCICVTGMGVITPDFDPLDYLIKTQVLTAEEGRELKEAYDLAHFYTLAAAAMALKDAGLSTENLAQFYPDAERRIAVAGITSIGLGKILEFHQLSQQPRSADKKLGEDYPHLALLASIPASIGYELHRLGFSGRSKNIFSEYDAGLLAVAEGAEMLLNNPDWEIALVGAVEANASPLVSRMFQAANLSSFTPANGAGFVVLERLSNLKQQGRQALAEISGFSIQQPLFEQSEAALQTIEKAMQAAQVPKEENGKWRNCKG